MASHDTAGERSVRVFAPEVVAPPGASDAGRFLDAIARIDAANADDPARIVVGGESRPKELTHASMLTEWVRRLDADAGEALLLAARAHHIRRWEIPRSTYPEGRQGYLRWRRDLHPFHAEQAGQILRDVGYDEATISRVQQIIRKLRLRTDPEVQALEDGLCLVFLETQFDELSGRLDDDKMIDVVRKTWRKMSERGRELALTLPLSESASDIVRRALAAESPPGEGEEWGAAGR